MRIFVFTLLFIIVYVPSILAQEELLDYKRAKELVSNEDFGQAMDLLRPFMDFEKYGVVANYASYHFAKAAYGNRQFELAKNSLSQILEEGNWKHQDDARYLLALCHFQQQEISEALTEIANLRDENVLKEAYRASYDFLQHISTSILIVNLPKFERNKGLVMALRNQLESRSILSAGEQTVYDQIKDYKFFDGDDDEFTRELNQTLEVAIVLPFNYNGGSGVKELGDNNFVFELYKGINFALNEAKEKGISLIIRTFDTERNRDVVNSILEDPFFKLADIIVGPIYPEESDMVAKFAESQKIPFINPLSNINDNQSDSGYSYLFRPSVKAISEGILNYNKKLPGKRIAVAYSGTTRDELLAGQYVESAKDMGFQIVQNRKVSAKDMRDFFDNLSLKIEDSVRADQIVIFSDDPNIASPTFAVLESLNPEVPVLVMDSWLYFNFASYEMFDMQNFHFIGNNTVNVNLEEVEDFRERFFDKYNVYPDLNAHLGYEIIHWITNSINSKKGFDFQKNLDRDGFQNGKLTFGYDFTNSRSNNYVPILKLEDGVLEVE
ncbi:MAG: ABC transporter substrate-binding protein [Anditalea sp.]